MPLLMTMVVIAIIGILTSMLLPALSMAREAGKNIVCLNNEKQMGLAMINYADSYQGYFPEAVWRTISYDDRLSEYDGRGGLTQGQWDEEGLQTAGANPVSRDSGQFYLCPSDNAENGNFLMR